MTIDDVIAQFREEMPPAFAGTELDNLTKKGYRYRTLLNEISRGEAPSDILIKQGKKKNIIIRDKFLPYWRSKLTPAEAA